MRKVILVAHNIRSTHNVGAFFRTCDGLGITKIIFSGYTPYPKLEKDSRLPHLSDKITRQIHKTALGAETQVDFEYQETIQAVVTKVKQTKALLLVLEQTKTSYTPEAVTARLSSEYRDYVIYLIVGNEIRGVDRDVIKQADLVMEIPMKGKKESLNVSVATGIALYELTK